MSELEDLLTNLYTKFVLRDLLSFVLPGFTLFFVCSLLFHDPMRIVHRLLMSPEISWFSIILIFLISYFVGVLLIVLSDMTQFFKTYYTINPEDQQKRVKRFYEELSCHFQNNKKEFSQIRERYVIFMQTCGNFSWVFIILILPIAHACACSNDGNSFPLLLLFVILLALSITGYCIFRTRLIDWDNLFLSYQCEEMGRLCPLIIKFTDFMKKITNQPRKNP
jgi:hypothetical protein